MRSTPSFAPKVVTLPGFTITNLAVTGGQVTLQWKDGVPPFQVIGEPTLYGPWNDVGNPTTARSKVFPEDINHFFTVQGSIVMPLVATQTNNLTRLTWEAPDTAMSDSLQAFTLKRSTDNGATFPTTVAVVQPGQPYSVDDTTAIPPGGSLTWELLEQTLNGVVVPYSKPVASNVAPGTALWARGAIGSTSREPQTGFDDQVLAVDIDSSGSIFTTGYTGVAPDLGGGQLLPSAIGSENLFFAKYSSVNSYLWGAACGFSRGNTSINTGAHGNGIALKNGNVFACGVVKGPLGAVYDFSSIESIPAGSSTAIGTWDIFVAKYADTGTSPHFLWVKRFGTTDVDQYGLPTLQCEAKAVAVDGNGDVFVTGYYQGHVNFGNQTLYCTAGSEIFILKLSGTDGTTLWSKRIITSPPAPPADHSGAGAGGWSIAVDLQNNIAVCGDFSTLEIVPYADFGNGIHLVCAGNADGWVAKFSGSDGTCVWAHGFGTTNNENCYAVTVDTRINPATGLPFNEVIIGETTESGVSVIKYNSDGTVKWSYPATGIIGGGHCQIRGLRVDSHGNIVFGGPFSFTFTIDTVPPTTITGGGGVHIYVIKLDQNGKAVWGKSYASTGGPFGSGGGKDELQSLAIAPDDSIVFVGDWPATNFLVTVIYSFIIDGITIPAVSGFDGIMVKLRP